jgi:hypothetical protein
MDQKKDSPSSVPPPPIPTVQIKENGTLRGDRKKGDILMIRNRSIVSIDTRQPIQSTSTPPASKKNDGVFLIPRNIIVETLTKSFGNEVSLMLLDKLLFKLSTATLASLSVEKKITDYVSYLRETLCLHRYTRILPDRQHKVLRKITEMSVEYKIQRRTLIQCWEIVDGSMVSWNPLGSARSMIDGHNLGTLYILFKDGPLLSHSCDPNCIPIVTKDRYWLLARRDLKNNEKLTVCMSPSLIRPSDNRILRMKKIWKENLRYNMDSYSQNGSIAEHTTTHLMCDCTLCAQQKESRKAFLVKEKEKRKKKEENGLGVGLALDDKKDENVENINENENDNDAIMQLILSKMQSDAVSKSSGISVPSGTAAAIAALKMFKFGVKTATNKETVEVKGLITHEIYSTVLKEMYSYLHLGFEKWYSALLLLIQFSEEENEEENQDDGLVYEKNEKEKDQKKDQKRETDELKSSSKVCFDLTKTLHLTPSLVHEQFMARIVQAMEMSRLTGDYYDQIVLWYCYVLLVSEKLLLFDKESELSSPPIIIKRGIICPSRSKYIYDKMEDIYRKYNVKGNDDKEKEKKKEKNDNGHLIQRIPAMAEDLYTLYMNYIFMFYACNKFGIADMVKEITKNENSNGSGIGQVTLDFNELLESDNISAYVIRHANQIGMERQIMQYFVDSADENSHMRLGVRRLCYNFVIAFVKAKTG